MYCYQAFDAAAGDNHYSGQNGSHDGTQRCFSRRVAEGDRQATIDRDLQAGDNAITTYGCDGWGNQTSHIVTAGSSYTCSAQPNAQNQLGPSGSTFDASGNISYDGSHCIRLL